MMKILLLSVFAVMVTVEQAAPLSDNNTTPATTNTTTTTNAPITDDTTNIDLLKTKAVSKLTSVLQEIQWLENRTGETYNLSSHHGCYTRHEPTNDVDINTLRDDVISFNQLLTVIKGFADNETDYKILNYYQEIIYSMENTIVALNDLITALEKKDNEEQDDEEEEEEGEDDEKEEEEEDDDELHMGSGDKITLTDSSDQTETDRCDQLDKAAKLGALKYQVLLTGQHISAL